MIPFDPISQNVLTASLATFNKVAIGAYSIIALIVIFRVVLGLMTVAPLSHYIDLLGNIILFFISIKLFPHGLNIATKLIDDLAARLTFKLDGHSTEEALNFLEKITSDYELLFIMFRFLDLSVVELTRAIFSFLFGTIISIAPLFFLLALIFNQNSVVKIYLFTLAALLFWPVTWNILGLLSINLVKQFDEGPVSSIMFTLATNALQFLSPIFNYALLKNVNPSSIGSSWRKTYVTLKK